MDEIEKELENMDNRSKEIHSAIESNNELQSALSRVETNFPQYRKKFQTDTGFAFSYRGNDIVTVDIVDDAYGIPKGSVCINVMTKKGSKSCLFSDFDEEMQKSMIELL
jgi:hypothetical protein